MNTNKKHSTDLNTIEGCAVMIECFARLPHDESVKMKWGAILRELCETYHKKKMESGDRGRKEIELPSEAWWKWVDNQDSAQYRQGLKDGVRTVQELNWSGK